MAPELILLEGKRDAAMDHTVLLRLARASLVLSPSEIETVKKLGPPLRQYLRNKAHDLVAADEYAPVLFQYSNAADDVGDILQLGR